MEAETISAGYDSDFIHIEGLVAWRFTYFNLSPMLCNG